MATEKMTNLPSGAAADEVAKALKGKTSGDFSFQATTSTPNRFNALKVVSDMLKSSGYKVVDMKTEKNGSVSMNFKLPDGGAPEIVESDQHQPLRNYDREIENRKVIRFLNTKIFTEFSWRRQ
ncbi:hypothetical protein AB3S75_047329 [Citrus x aurantiifolia]